MLQPYFKMDSRHQFLQNIPFNVKGKEVCLELKNKTKNKPKYISVLQHSTNPACIVEWPDGNHYTVNVVQNAPEGLSEHEKQHSLV